MGTGKHSVIGIMTAMVLDHSAIHPNKTCIMSSINIAIPYHFLIASPLFSSSLITPDISCPQQSSCPPFSPFICTCTCTVHTYPHTFSTTGMFFVLSYYIQQPTCPSSYLITSNNRPVHCCFIKFCVNRKPFPK